MPNVILATAGHDHTIRLWEARSGFCYRTLQFNDSVCLVFPQTINSNNIILNLFQQILIF